MKSKQSVYSKMYLVTPNVYDKVLQNLDEKLKKTTAELNIEKQTEDRPSGKILEDISAQEVQSEALDIPDNPEFIDPALQEQISEPTFGQSEITEPGEVIEQQPQSVEVANQPQEVNPLTTSCAQPQVQDQFIPLIQKQGLKRQRVTKGKISKQVIVPSILKNKPLQVIVPSIIKNPQIQRVQQESNINPNIKRVQVTRPEPSAMIKDIKIRPRKFVCNVCLKGFASNYHLNRHISTVHKNLANITADTAVQTLPDDDEEMDRPVFPKPSTSKQFQSWKDDKTPVQRVKRTMGDAKLKETTRPTKSRPGDDWFEPWSK